MLVARHENDISRTTDVCSRPQFASRRTTKVVHGRELKTLRAVERIPQLRQANTLYDGRVEIATLDEILELARTASERTGRAIGVYAETKHPSYFAGLGLSLTEPLVATLEAHGLGNPTDPVFLQSFEVGNLAELSRRTGVRLIQLLSKAGRPYDLEAAGDPRSYGLLVHCYTFSQRERLPPADLRLGRREADYGNALAEYAAFLDAGVDGVFTDNPDTARLAHDERATRRSAAA